MISHFHYDPVWWNTQAAYTATWDDLPGQAQQFRQDFQQTGFALVDAHLEAARRDPDYKFVLAEVDYLKPYWDARPRAARLSCAACWPKGASGDHGRHLQRAEHEPDHDRDDDPQLRPRRRFPAWRARRRPAHRLAARRLRPRPAVPGSRRRGGPDLVVVGARSTPPMGADAVATASRRRLGRSVGDAVPGRVRVDLAVRQGRAHALHAGALLGRLADRLQAHPRRGARVRCTSCSCCSSGSPRRATCCCPSAPTTRRRASGSPTSSATGTPGIARRGSTAPCPREFFAAVRAELEARAAAPRAADPRHEPGLHRQGRVASSTPSRRSARPRACSSTRRCSPRSPRVRRALPARDAGQGVAPAGVRCPPRRDHRLGIRPGLPRSAHHLARGARSRPATYCMPRSTIWRHDCPATADRGTAGDGLQPVGVAARRAPSRSTSSRHRRCPSLRGGSAGRDTSCRA